MADKTSVKVTDDPEQQSHQRGETDENRLRPSSPHLQPPLPVPQTQRTKTESRQNSQRVDFHHHGSDTTSIYEENRQLLQTEEVNTHSDIDTSSTVLEANQISDEQLYELGTLVGSLVRLIDGNAKIKLKESVVKIDKLFKALINSNTCLKKQNTSLVQKLNEVQKEKIFLQVKIREVENAAENYLQPMYTKIAKVTESLENKLPASTSLSYAQAAAFPPLPPTEHGLLIEPGENISLQHLEKELNNHVQKDIQLNCFRTKTGKLLVKTHEENLSQLKASIQPLASKLTIRELNPQQQKLIIFDAPQAPEINSSKLQEYAQDILRPTIARILHQEEPKFRIVRVLKSKEGPSSNLVIETEKRHALILLQAKRIPIGFMRCGIKEYITIFRCTKCQSLDHTTTRCREANPFCAKCTKCHHTNDCVVKLEDKDKLLCINCKEQSDSMDKPLNFHHAAFSSGCPIYRRRLQAAISQQPQTSGARQQRREEGVHNSTAVPYKQSHSSSYKI